MKKGKLFLGLLVALLAIGLVFGGCNFPTGGNDENGDGGGSGNGGGSSGNTSKAPTGVTATAQSSSSIKISWNAVTGASSYCVYRSDNASGPYAELGAGTLGGSSIFGTSYTNSNLSPATTFYYKVAARNGTQSDPVFATTWLVAPSGINAMSETSSSITISWNNLSGATAYRIYRSGSNYGSYTEIDTSASNSYTDTGLPSNVRYFYKTSGYNNITDGDQSTSDDATTLLKAPTGVTATAQSSSSIRITWNAVTDAFSYRVYRSNNVSGPYAELGAGTLGGSSISGTSYTNSGLSPATTFYYKVAAYRGEQSDIVFATTN